jgi:hypothetical protein
MTDAALEPEGSRGRDQAQSSARRWGASAPISPGSALANLPVRDRDQSPWNGSLTFPYAVPETGLLGSVSYLFRAVASPALALHGQ